MHYENPFEFMPLIASKFQFPPPPLWGWLGSAALSHMHAFNANQSLSSIFYKSTTMSYGLLFNQWPNKC